MMHAYQEMYLSSARAHLGEAFDHAVHICHCPGPDFGKAFVISDVSKRMENGETAYLLGKSGIEIALEVLDLFDVEAYRVARQDAARSMEYWIGFAVAHYQWYSNRSFHEIFTALPYEDLEKLYPTLHEADVTKFTALADERMHETYPSTNLKILRTLYGMSQSELARASGVSLRSIQMYEQRNKDINRASGETLYRLARTLGCSMERLLEW